MKIEETTKIIAYIKTAYPNAWNDKSKEEMQRIIKTWHLSLKDYEYQNIYLATKAYIETDSKGYPPSIGQILNKYRIMTKPKQLSELEIRSIIDKATRNGNYGAEDEFNKMPREVQRIIGSPDRIRAIASQDEDQAEITINAIIKSYRYVREAEDEYNEIPESTSIGLKELLRLAQNHNEE